MSEYTPTTEQVESDWISAQITESDYWDALTEEEAQARWDRWLAAHDARVRVDTLEAFERIIHTVITEFVNEPRWANGDRMDTHQALAAGYGVQQVLTRARAANIREGNEQ